MARKLGAPMAGPGMPMKKRAPKPAPLPKVGGPMQPAPGGPSMGRSAAPAPLAGRAKAATMGQGKKRGLRKMGY